VAAHTKTEVGGALTEVSHRPASGASQAAFRCAGWIIQPAFFRCEGPNGCVTIEPRCMQVLVVLAGRAGEVVSRRELLDTVWFDVTVGEEVLTRAVSQLRQVFDDDPREPRFIETIRGGGYRLVAAVDQVPESPGDARAGVAPVTRGRFGRLAWLSGVAAVLVAWGGFVVLGSRPGGPDGVQPGVGFVEGMPLTTAPGQELFPAVAPAGNMVVFTAGTGDRSGLYLTQAGADRWVRLTESPGFDRHPRWTEDGSRILFERRDAGSSALCVVSALGGAVRCGPSLPGRVFGLDNVPGANQVVLCSSPPEECVIPLRLVDLESWQARDLTSPNPDEFTGDSQPRFSPDGRRLGFVRCDHAGVQDLWIMRWPGGEPARLTHGLGSILGFSWSRDARYLIVAAAPDGRWRLWRVDVGSGERTLIPTPDRQAIHPSIDPMTGSLVYVSRHVNDSIWRLETAADGSSLLEAVAESSRRDSAPSWFPDGERVAFVSDRSGSWQVWSADIATRNATKLTDFDLGQPGRPYVSPDGNRLAFSLLETKAERLVLLDLASGRVQRLGAVGTHDMAIGWTPDGRVVARCDLQGQWRVVLVEPETRNVERLDLPGYDGRQVRMMGGRAFFVDGQGSLRTWDLATREVQELAPPGVVDTWASWTPSSGCVLFVEKNGGFVLNAYDPESGDVTRDVFKLPDSTVSITPSPDGRALLAVRRMQGESDLMTLAGVG